MSNTLKQIQIGMKSKLEWIGEDLLIMDDPHKNTFEYTAVAETKCTAYMINYADMFKIPVKVRDHMANIARIRRQVIIVRTLELYHNLKSIK